MSSPFKETGVLYSKEQPDQYIVQSPLLDPEDVNETESNDEWEGGLVERQLFPVDVEQQNLELSQDTGWELYRYEINDLLIRTTGQPGQSLSGSSFQKAVAAWKRINGFQFDGILDKETWGRMATRLHIPALVFSTKELYANMGLASAGLPFDAFRLACNGFRKLDKDLKLAKQRILSIADFTQTSDKKRLYILDLADQKILIQTKVAHGAGSVKRGDHYSKASLFSNTDGSHQSSLGFYITAKPFTMRDHVDKKGVRHARGYALRIDGQEKGFNSNARARSIVIHQAEYVPDAPGPAGPSWGCPAVSGAMYVKVIDTIKDGCCFFIYYNDPVYLSKSVLAGNLSARTPFVQESFNEPAPFGSEEEQYESEAYPDYEQEEETGELVQDQEENLYQQDEGANRDYEGSSAYEWEEESYETDEAVQQEDESDTPVTSMLFTATQDLTAEEAAAQTESEFWITKITDKVAGLSFWLKKGPAILFKLMSLFQKGQRDPVQLTTKIFNDVLHPERKGKPIDTSEAALQKEWNELYSFVVGPYLLSAGYAIKTLPGNVLIPGTPQPTLLKPNEYGLVQFPSSGNGFARYTSGVDDVYKHPVTGVVGKHGDNWMSPTTAVDFYNLIHDFHASAVGPDYEEEESNNFSNYEEPVTGLEEVLFEGLVPVVSLPDLKTRLDDYLNKANATYTLDTGSTINCFSQFRLATTNIVAPEDAKEKVKKQLRKTTAGAKFAADNSLAIHFSAYGRATPGEIKKITQALIDSGALAAIRTDNPGNNDRQLVRKMQRSFGVGTDCAGYVQMAFIFAYTGNDSDGKAKRLKLGLKASRGDENLGSLSSVHFKKFNILDAQTGDLLILNARPTDTDRMGHTVIIADHKKTGTKHEFLVDASWGVDTYGIDAGGIARHSFFFDSATGNWSDKHPLTGSIVHTNSTGPYDGHIIAGVFRPKT